MSHYLDDAKTSLILFFIIVIIILFLKWSDVQQRHIYPIDVSRSPVFCSYLEEMAVRKCSTNVPVSWLNTQIQPCCWLRVM